jgi:hypothetical protein
MRRSLFRFAESATKTTTVLPPGLAAAPKARVGSSVFGAVAALFLGAAIVDESINVVVGFHSSRWDYVEGEITGEGVEV